MSQLPVLAFIPEIKAGFPEQPCHKPVLPAWSPGAAAESQNTQLRSGSGSVFNLCKCGNGKREAGMDKVKHI